MGTLSKCVPERQGTIFAAVPLTFALSAIVLQPRWALISVPVVCLGSGFLLKHLPAGRTAPRTDSLLFLLSPALFLNVLIFFQPVWYYKGPRPPTSVHRILEDLHSGLSFTSLAQLRETASLDDRTLREIGRLSRERPGSTTVVWENGPNVMAKN